MKIVYPTWNCNYPEVQQVKAPDQNLVLANNYDSILNKLKKNMINVDLDDKGNHKELDPKIMAEVAATLEKFLNTLKNKKSNQIPLNKLNFDYGLIYDKNGKIPFPKSSQDLDDF